jgi:hypothetical protein
MIFIFFIILITILISANVTLFAINYDLAKKQNTNPVEIQFSELRDIYYPKDTIFIEFTPDTSFNPKDQLFQWNISINNNDNFLPLLKVKSNRFISWYIPEGFTSSDIRLKVTCITTTRPFKNNITIPIKIRTKLYIYDLPTSVIYGNTITLNTSSLTTETRVLVSGDNIAWYISPDTTSYTSTISWKVPLIQGYNKTLVKLANNTSESELYTTKIFNSYGTDLYGLFYWKYLNPGNIFYDSNIHATNELIRLEWRYYTNSNIKTISVISPENNTTFFSTYDVSLLYCDVSFPSAGSYTVQLIDNDDEFNTLYFRNITVQSLDLTFRTGTTEVSITPSTIVPTETIVSFISSYPINSSNVTIKLENSAWSSNLLALKTFVGTTPSWYVDEEKTVSLNYGSQTIVSKTFTSDDGRGHFQYLGGPINMIMSPKHIDKDIPKGFDTNNFLVTFNYQKLRYFIRNITKYERKRTTPHNEILFCLTHDIYFFNTIQYPISRPYGIQTDIQSINRMTLFRGTDSEYGYNFANGQYWNEPLGDTADEWEWLEETDVAEARPILDADFLSLSAVAIHKDGNYIKLYVNGRHVLTNYLFDITTLDISKFVIGFGRFSIADDIRVYSITDSSVVESTLVPRTYSDFQNQTFTTTEGSGYTLTIHSSRNIPSTEAYNTYTPATSDIRYRAMHPVEGTYNEYIDENIVISQQPATNLPITYHYLSEWGQFINQNGSWGTTVETDFQYAELSNKKYIRIVSIYYSNDDQGTVYSTLKNSSNNTTIFTLQQTSENCLSYKVYIIDMEAFIDFDINTLSVTFTHNLTSNSGLAFFVQYNNQIYPSTVETTASGDPGLPTIPLLFYEDTSIQYSSNPNNDESVYGDTYSNAFRYYDCKVQYPAPSSYTFEIPSS